MVLSLLAVLDGGVVEPPTRVEVPIPDDTDADVKIMAEIRKDGNGKYHVELKPHYEVAFGHV
jgi:hypothetical protein